jgi:hypothetical protein
VSAVSRRADAIRSMQRDRSARARRSLAAAIAACGAACSAAATLAACGDDREVDVDRGGVLAALELDVQRGSRSLALRHREHGVELAAVDVRIADNRVVLTARLPGLQGTLDLLATGPGVPVSGALRAEAAGVAAELVVRNGRALLASGDRPSLTDAREHDHAHRALAGTPLLPLLTALAPYREAMLARLAEAAPLVPALGLFQAWPDGVEPVWPQLTDPRDLDPPGLLDGDRIGVGMTCSPQIRCPDSAPFCVSQDHDAPYGFCTRACGGDADCRGEAGTSLARCGLAVVDVPAVAEPVTMCRIDCAASDQSSDQSSARASCPALLACRGSDAMCWPPR